MICVKDAAGDEDEKDFTLKDLFTWLKFPFFVGVCMVICQQFTGVNSVVFYSNDMFKDSGIDPTLATIMVLTFKLFVTISLGLVIELAGRKTMLTIG
jgi:hypothetical protein